MKNFSAILLVTLFCGSCFYGLNSCSNDDSDSLIGDSELALAKKEDLSKLRTTLSNYQQKFMEENKIEVTKGPRTQRLLAALGADCKGFVGHINKTSTIRLVLIGPIEVATGIVQGIGASIDQFIEDGENGNYRVSTDDLHDSYSGLDFSEVINTSELGELHNDGIFYIFNQLEGALIDTLSTRTIVSLACDFVESKNYSLGEKRDQIEASVTETLTLDPTDANTCDRLSKNLQESNSELNALIDDFVNVAVLIQDSVQLRRFTEESIHFVNTSDVPGDAKIAISGGMAIANGSSRIWSYVE